MEKEQLIVVVNLHKTRISIQSDKPTKVVTFS